MKCKNLKLLRDGGINVPEFVVLEFGQLTDPHVDLDGLLDDFAFSPTHRYAVRSSSSVEDREDTSFAGQFDTYLNVESHELKGKVLLCLESLHSSGALEYARQHQLDPRLWEMNVIIQKMVHADLSGILFTANPQGLLNESVIVVGKGLGDQIVSDQAETTSYYFSNTDRMYYYDGMSDYLNHETILELIETGERIKKIMGYAYLDIEFALLDNVLHILQARPVTTLDDRNPTVFDNSNIVESYPGITLPLTDSFVNSVYTGVFKGVASRILKNSRLLDSYDAVFGNMVGSVNGRMYYKISSWYTVIKFLPFSSRIIPVWQEMLGVKQRNYEKSPVSLSGFQRIRTYFNAFAAFVQVPSAMKSLNQRFEQVYAGFDSGQLPTLTNPELVERYQEIREKLLGVWDITLLNDMYAFIFTGVLKQRLKKKYPDHYEEKIIEFITGISNIESLKPIRELLELADLSVMNQETDGYRRRFNGYIQVYGDRLLEELKLESETFRTSPWLLEEKIKEYSSDSEKLKQMRDALNKQPEHSLNGNGFIIDFCSKNAMLGIQNREISRLNRCRIYGMVRSIFLSIGANFHNDRLIQEPRDIFYLTINEVFERVYSPKEVWSLIERRKAEYQQYALLPSYSRLIFSGPAFSKKHRFVNACRKAEIQDHLSGIPCSAGTVTGEVLVVDDVKNVKNAKGKILVAKMTDPGWVFVLANARGIIVEKGSLLSHTAIVSRELKIPSIVAAEGAMDVLKNGDIVTMNGHTGTIEIMR